MIKQTRIFAPYGGLFDEATWAETLLGKVITPVVHDMAATLEWFFISRYIATPEEDSDDCDITSIPLEFRRPADDRFRSVRFRYSIGDAQVEQFERICQDLIDESGCRISDFREYRLVADLGSDRHVGGNRSPERRERRAEIVVGLYHLVSRLVLDALVGPDTQGKFRIEHNDSPEAPLNSSFAIPHHMFCNITEVPLRVLVSGDALGTDIYPPTNPVGALPIRF